MGSYVFASVYCHPSGDDFTYAAKARGGEILQLVLNERYETNGRYASNFLMLSSPLNWGGITAYKLMPVILIGSFFAGLLLFFRLIVNQHLLLITTVSALIALSIMPDITEGIYWYTGAYTYTLSALLLLLATAILVRNQTYIKLKSHACAVGLIIIASGFNETILLYGMAASGLMAVRARFSKLSLAYVLLFSLLLIYVFTAPGNAVRASQFSESHQLLHSFAMSLVYSARFIGEWLLNPAFLLWAIVLLKLNLKDNASARLQFLRNPIAVVLVLILPIMISSFGPLYSTGMLGQYRTANLASILFAPSFTLIILANKDFLLPKLRSTLLQKLAFPLLLLCLLTWKNQFYLFKELISGDMAHFDAEMHDRYERIQRCEENFCYLPELVHQPKTLFVYALSDDPEHWRNKSYQLYFNSAEIGKMDATDE